MSRLSGPVDAFPGETDGDYRARMERWLASQPCTERESGGVRCEKSAAHTEPCACPEAMSRWLHKRYGTKAIEGVVGHA